MNSLHFFSLGLLRRYLPAPVIWVWMLALVAPPAAQPQAPLMESESLSRQKSGERWVCTWATAQELAPVTFPDGGPGRSGPPDRD